MFLDVLGVNYPVELQFSFPQQFHVLLAIFFFPWPRSRRRTNRSISLSSNYAVFSSMGQSPAREAQSPRRRYRHRLCGRHQVNPAPWSVFCNVPDPLLFACWKLYFLCVSYRLNSNFRISSAEIITGQTIPRTNRNPKFPAQKMANITEAFNFMEKFLKIRVVGCNATGLCSFSRFYSSLTP